MPRAVVALIPARTDTAYCHEHVATDADVFLLRGRLKFGQSGQSAPFPLALAVWGGSAHELMALHRALPDAWQA
jgi:site-specific DNA-methyltransferase (adenine-specific)